MALPVGNQCVFAHLVGHDFRQLARAAVDEVLVRVWVRVMMRVRVC